MSGCSCRHTMGCRRQCRKRHPCPQSSHTRMRSTCSSTSQATSSRALPAPQQHTTQPAAVGCQTRTHMQVTHVFCTVPIWCVLVVDRHCF